MGLSSNILWHQTDKDGFKDILKSKCLTCSYCLEFFLDKQHKIGFPMISLSDIPIADIEEYLDQYGGYSFGFSRDWVIKSGFNPVWYCEKSNQATRQHTRMLYDRFKNPPKNNNDDIVPILTLLFYYGAYMKEIEGPLTVKSKNLIYTNYRFYDEREYRFVPDYNELLNKGVKPIVDEGQYNHYKEEHGNTHLNISLPFTFNDLKIIIVKTDKQVKKLKKLFKEKDIHIFSHKEIKQSIIGKGHQITRKNISK